VLARAALVGTALLAAACDHGAKTAAETLRDYYDAVQERDFDRLYCLMAGAAEAVELGAEEAERRAGFERWARAYYEAYESGRDEGWVDLDDQGLALVKLFSLGRGTYATHERKRSAGPDALVVGSRIRFVYAHVDLSPFSPGTTFYVCGAPAGRVHPIRVPAGSGEVTVDALEGIAVEWTLVRAPARGGCPEGWTVVSGEVIADSATTTEITWVF
jgi:hypothetical protein